MSDRIKLALRIGFPCSWVQTHIPAYLQWDISLAPKEFGAIDRHLSTCPKCAAAAERIKPILAALDAAGGAPPDVTNTPEVLASAVLARLAASDTNLHKNQWPSQRLRPVPWLALAAGLLIVAAPVFAYLGVQLAQYFQPEHNSASTTFRPESTKIAHGPILSTTAPVSTHPKWSKSAKSPPIGDHGLDQATATLADHAAARAQIDASLPKSDEQYEAWARREYPHIMWLYDVLMGQPPKRPPDSPAGRMVRFGVDDDGNPAITLPDAEGKVVTLSVPYPGNGPWDGAPVNIPEWGVRLYASIPESERPTGWRALLIYCGEILRFDCPTSADKPNRIPSHEAMQEAAAVAGYSNESTQDGVWKPKPLHSAEPQTQCRRANVIPATPPQPVPISAQVLPPGYVEQLVSNPAAARAVLVYLSACSKLLSTPEFVELSISAKNLMANLSTDSTTVCNLALLAEQMNAVFTLRELQLPEEFR
ncbi:MAG: hypothetical protein NTZ09_02945 [Candidatus Hydrogenedentes bacterium]|nr:hypothetical protein [Candidatus Hydrogenedentota bacterium]